MLRVASLFSGGGGWEAGVDSLGVFGTVHVLAVEKEHWIAKVHERAFGGHVVADDVANVDFYRLAAKLGTVDILFSSPPCQPTSKAGVAWVTRRAAMGLPSKEDSCDPNIGVYTIDAVDALKPKVVFVENNEAYARSGTFARVRDALVARGYHVDQAVVSASDYGVPSGRRRLILRASRGPLPPWPKKEPRVSWWRAIEDLPLEPSTLAPWQARALAAHPGPAGVPLLIAGGNPTRYGGKTIVWKTPDQEAWATQTRQNTAGMRVIDQEGVVRQLSVRALARLQGFPETSARARRGGTLFPRTCTAFDLVMPSIG